MSKTGVGCLICEHACALYQSSPLGYMLVRCDVDDGVTSEVTGDCSKPEARIHPSFRKKAT